MSITGFSHVNIGIRDAEKCLPFYCDVLGMVVSLDDDDRHQLSDRKYHRRAIYLRWQSGPKQSFIVLDLDHGRKESGAPPQLAAIGINHFGLWVDDIAAILDRARQGGYRIPHDDHPCAGRHYGYDAPDGEAFVRTAFLLDPEDNLVQLDQWVKEG